MAGCEGLTFHGVSRAAWSAIKHAAAAYGISGGDSGQDLPFLTVVFLGKIPVDRGLGALVGKVSAPAPEVGRAGPVEVHIVRHRGLLS